MDIVDHVVKSIDAKMELLTAMEDTEYRKHQDLAEAQMVLHQVYADIMYLVHIRDRDVTCISTRYISDMLHTVDVHKSLLDQTIRRHIGYADATRAVA